MRRLICSNRECEGSPRLFATGSVVVDADRKLSDSMEQDSTDFFTCVYCHAEAMEEEKPCLRSYDPIPSEPDTPQWNCDNDHTGCLWNNGHNGCGHDGNSLSPLEET